MRKTIPFLLCLVLVACFSENKETEFICKAGKVKSGDSSCRNPSTGKYTDLRGQEHNCTPVIGNTTLGGQPVLVKDAESCPFTCARGYVQDEDDRECRIPYAGKYADVNGQERDCSPITGESARLFGGQAIRVEGPESCPFTCFSNHYAKGKACLAKPKLSITTHKNITTFNASHFIIKGTCSEEGSNNVFVSVGGQNLDTHPNCLNGHWRTTPQDLSLLNTERVQVVAKHSNSDGSVSEATDFTYLANRFRCPVGFMPVPSLSGYTERAFCVAKYEMKNKANTATSEAAGSPWVDINQNTAKTKCESLSSSIGSYSLITNDEWQTLARNIESVNENWSNGSSGSGALSHGHSNGSPDNALLASSNDQEACFNKSISGSACSDSIWHAQRRTHILSNGEVIWDMAGNVGEWMANRNNENFNNGGGGNRIFISAVADSTHSDTINLILDGNAGLSRTAKAQFGPAGTYNTGVGTPYLGFGYAVLNRADGEGNTGNTVVRGGSWDSGGSDGVNAGVFATFLIYLNTFTGTNVGFRCVFHPSD